MSDDTPPPPPPVPAAAAADAVAGEDGENGDGEAGNGAVLQGLLRRLGAVSYFLKRGKRGKESGSL